MKNIDAVKYIKQEMKRTGMNNISIYTGNLKNNLKKELKKYFIILPESCGYTKFQVK